MTTLIIARHGNTFGPEDTLTRVGAHTDLPLVEKGEEQARAIGRYLKENGLIPDVVYSSKLQRTIQTAKIAIKESGVTNPVFELDIFNEIDYGPDENQPEDIVAERIGAQAIIDWDERAIVPDGWKVDPDEIIQNWINFASHIASPPPDLSDPPPPGGGRIEVGGQDDEIHLVVTSNGIARFAPYITGDFEAFSKKHKIKLSTGALAILKHDRENGWRVESWNVKP
ncbi:MAG: histidine phosphatase family protein [Alphaproteobacteria bacterium]